MMCVNVTRNIIVLMTAAGLQAKEERKQIRGLCGAARDQAGGKILD
jgi:hypothetical protein